MKKILNMDRKICFKSAAPPNAWCYEYKMHVWPIDLLHFGRADSEEVAFQV